MSSGEVRQITGKYFQYQLAHKFGVSQRTICLITRNEGWREKGAGK